ncbi:MAG: hypothetical protein JKY15_02025 [Deltaproteobacteria bacterium]|nr:hypothetical protein [Deltaproteobacteria bacterium]
MNDSYHEAITIYPNGAIYAGEHSEDRQPQGKAMIGRYVMKAKEFKNPYGLPLNAKVVGKTIPVAKLSALAAKIEANQFNPQALMGATSIGNSTNMSHLQMIRLFPEAQGVPDEYFWLDEMFVERDVSMLEGREPFYDTTATARYLDRLEVAKTTKTVYDEIKYDLKKLVDKVFTPIEDMMRTIINPQDIDLGQLRWGFKYQRNQKALLALKDIGNSQSAIGKFEKITSGNLHSDNHAAKELNELFNTFLKANDVKITHVAMNTTLFTEFSENTWTKSGPLDLNPIRLSGGGVVPLPGINGVTAIVDVSIPANTIYAVNKPNALRKGEGAKIMRRYYDEEHDAEAIKMLDFNQYLSTDKQITKLTRKFGMTIPVTP